MKPDIESPIGKVQDIAEKVDGGRCTDFLKKLISIPSVSGEEQKVAHWISERLGEIGFQEVEVDEWDNVIAKREGNRRQILMSVHLDTSHPHPDMGDPFDPIIKESEGEARLYGLGAASSKGSTASMLEALSVLTSSGEEMPSIIFTGVARDLLPKSGYGIRAVFREHAIDADAAIVGEPTDLKIGIGSRGLAHVKVTFYSEPTHAGRPDNNANPIAGMSKFISKTLEGPLPKHPLLGAASISPIECRSEGERPLTPWSASMVFDRRLLPNDPPIEELIEYYKSLAMSASGPMSCEIEIINHEYPWVVSEDSPIVTSLANSLRAVTSIQPIQYPLPFSSTAGYMKEFGKIQPVAFSGGDITKIGKNENVNLGKVITAAKVIAGTIVLFGAT
ncbi:MAG: M20/M25/M40 family metallo-hydrolase [Anaerolineales bacterium]